MEKKEAIREYCVETAMQLLVSTKQTATVDSVIELAQRLEDYITGVQHTTTFTSGTYGVVGKNATKV